MELGVHLPLMQFGGEPLSLRRLEEAVDAARESGFAAICANDHFVFATPWLDGLTALASMVERSGDMDVATTVALVAQRGPIALAKTLAALDVLSDGRLIAGLGPGSSRRDCDAVGMPFEERWPRFEEAIGVLRALLDGEPVPQDARYYRMPADVELAPPPRRRIPLWIGSWGSRAGLRRVARAGDGWLASAYNTLPERFAEARAELAREAAARGRDEPPNALATMWTWVTHNRSERDRVLREALAPLLGRDPAELAEQVCVGSPDHCAELLSRYARAGCGRVYLWPLGDDRRQIGLMAREVVPLIDGGTGRVR